MKTTLYIFEPTVVDLLWSPAPPTLQEARDIYAVDEIEHPPKLVTAISQLPQGTIVHILPETVQFPNIAASEVDGLQATLQSASAKTSEYLLPALHKTRLIKDPYEIAMIRKANDISSRAHEVIMRVLGLAVEIKEQSSRTPLLPGEWLIRKEAEAEAIFVASCRREGSVILICSVLSSSRRIPYFIVVPHTKLICLSWQLRLGHRHCIIAAMTVHLHGVQSITETRLTRGTFRMCIPVATAMESGQNCCRRCC